MLALAAMRPIAAFDKDEKQQPTGKGASVPTKAEPALADFENDCILTLARISHRIRCIGA
jgi:hypothetical protein